jgi:hypothetical protein
MPDDYWDCGIIEGTTQTGLHEFLIQYDSIEDLEKWIRGLVHDGYVITHFS